MSRFGVTIAHDVCGKCVCVNVQVFFKFFLCFCKKRNKQEHINESIFQKDKHTHFSYYYDHYDLGCLLCSIMLHALIGVRQATVLGMTTVGAFERCFYLHFNVRAHAEKTPSFAKSQRNGPHSQELRGNTYVLRPQGKTVSPSTNSCIICRSLFSFDKGFPGEWHVLFGPK